jgi:HD-GYP domain-containing protein (c-di-GMP phosphodiesterase class II)
VADTFHAITSDRSYRSQKTPEQALAIMDEVAGKQLDPNLVRVFKKVYVDSVVSQVEEIFFEEISQSRG